MTIVASSLWTKLPHCRRLLRTSARARWSPACCNGLMNGAVSSRRLHLAIIGSGPAGFYTAQRVLKSLPEASIDMFEKLPVPFGLVRYGVAPDHPEVKNCQDKFEEIASSQRFTFYGNVSVGEQVKVRELAPYYHAILFAYGASTDRKLNIPGEDLPGVYSALDFVNWYNGVPDTTLFNPKLDASDTAVVIGNGNVALDVARILLSDLDTLRKTDIAETAISTLARSKIRRVDVVGRRGLLQAAFTTNVVRELSQMPDVSLKLDDLASLPTDNSNLSRQQRRLVSTISSGTQKVSGTSSRQCCLHFLLSPRSFHATAFGDAHYLSEIAFRRNKLLPPHHDVRAHIEPTDSDISIKASLAFRSIGYRAEPLADFKSLGVPFDIESGSVANDGAGRVLRSKTYDENNEDLKNLNIDPQTKIKSAVRIAASNVVSTSSTTFPALYVAGWLKTGPTGVIATTMYDSFAVGDAITADWELHKRRQENITRTGAKNDPASVKRLLHEKGIRAVSWRDWKVIDAAERERGKVLGKPRDKFLSKNDMLHLLDCK